jgi:hypothetical protein
MQQRKEMFERVERATHSALARFVPPTRDRSGAVNVTPLLDASRPVLSALRSLRNFEDRIRAGSPTKLKSPRIKRSR